MIDSNNNSDNSNQPTDNSDAAPADDRDYGRRVLLNHVLVLEAAHQQSQNEESYEELKRLILFAGIFFLFVIIFVLLKCQVSLDDVFKWSPVVWLIGVIVGGIIMNIALQIRKYFKKRRAKRLREQQDLLYSLNLPSSFPCLAPPPHDEHCCQFFTTATTTNEHHPLRAYRLTGSCQSLIALLPSYDQVMQGAKTWLLSKAAFPPTIGTRPIPPTYSTLMVDQPCTSTSQATETLPPSIALAPPPYEDEEPNINAIV